MPTPYAEVSIAGLPLETAGAEKCKALIVDGANFLITTTGSTQFAVDGTPYTQILDVTAGRAFGIRVDFMPPDLLADIVAAMVAAVSGGDTFNVTAVDDIHDINVACVPDFGQGFVSYSPQRTHPDVVRDITFRFITAE